MQIRKIGLAIVAATTLTACGNTDMERALSGAAIGGVGAVAIGGGATLGIVVGAAAGIFCNDTSPDYCID